MTNHRKLITIKLPITIGKLFNVSYRHRNNEECIVTHQY